jgi:phosphotriesterase-related protein
MPTVTSVLGPIDTSDLGVTLIHEHLLIGWPGWEKDPLVLFDKRDEIAKAVERLQELRALGVETFVDPCPVDIGRDVEFAAEVSSRANMHYIAATGMYKEELGMPTHFRQMDIDSLAELYVRELTEGIGGTGIRAGVIKVATAAPITEHETKNLRAAARAAKATNSRIITHTDAGSYGPQQIDIIEEEGLAPWHVMVGHSDGSSDLTYHDTLIRRRCYDGMDRFGLEFVHPDRLRVATLAGLLAIGYADRIMLSHDAVGCFLGRPRVLTPEQEALRAKWNYTHIHREILPLLREAGVREETIDTVLRENPRRFFEGVELEAPIDITTRAVAPV